MLVRPLKRYDDIDAGARESGGGQAEWPLETVAVYHRRYEAEIAKSQLAGAGISALIQADNEGGLSPGFFTNFGVRVVVRSADAAAAKWLLHDEPRRTNVVVPLQIRDAMIAHARFCFPQEACGLLAADATGALRMTYCAANADESATRFTVHPAELYGIFRHAERNGWEVAGVFHSHPSSAARPSRTDIELAPDPTWLYVIVSLADAEPDVRGFRLRRGDVVEEPLVTVPQ